MSTKQYNVDNVKIVLTAAGIPYADTKTVLRMIQTRKAQAQQLLVVGKRLLMYQSMRVYLSH